MADKIPKADKQKALEVDKKRKAELKRLQDRKIRVHRFDSTLGVFKIVFAILLGIAVISVLLGKPIVTFSSFLEFLQTCPQIPLDWLDWSALTLGDWGIFNVFRNFIMMNISFVNFLAFISTALLNFVTMVLWFFKWLFL